MEFENFRDKISDSARKSFYFRQKEKGEKFGKVIGYIIMYFVFTTILYFVFVFLKKLPENWNYFHIILVTIFITLLGSLLKLLLR